MKSFRSQMHIMTPYDIHRALINEYVLKRPGDTKYLRRDASNDKTDYDVIKENHKFLWEDDKNPNSWETQFAKKYYDKLFKEYCIGDLTRYKENKIACRWRVEQEVIAGKGQFICANKSCPEKEDLTSWEINFGYVEQGEKKNALVKIRLCPSCSKKLNYHTKKREVKRLKYPKHKSNRKEKSKVCAATSPRTEASTSAECIDIDSSDSVEKVEKSPWENFKPIDVKSRDDEMEEYLNDLLL